MAAAHHLNPSGDPAARPLLELLQGLLLLVERNMDEILANPDVPMYEQFAKLRHEQYKKRSDSRRGVVSCRRATAGDESDNDQDSSEVDHNDA